MSRRKQARPIRHLDDEDGGGPDGLDGQEEDIEASTTNTTGAGKFYFILFPPPKKRGTRKSVDSCRRLGAKSRPSDDK